MGDRPAELPWADVGGVSCSPRLSPAATSYSPSCLTCTCPHPDKSPGAPTCRPLKMHCFRGEEPDEEGHFPNTAASETPAVLSKHGVQGPCPSGLRHILHDGVPVRASDKSGGQLGSADPLLAGTSLRFAGPPSSLWGVSVGRVFLSKSQFSHLLSGK